MIKAVAEALDVACSLAWDENAEGQAIGPGIRVYRLSPSTRLHDDVVQVGIRSLVGHHR